MDHQTHPFQSQAKSLSRRAMLREAAAGFGFLGLAGMLGEESILNAAAAGHNPMLPKEPHFAPKAKRVIFLFMHGGPSTWPAS